MRLISHRGNINGKNIERENSPEYIKEALDEGYDVEIDVWYIPSELSMYGKFFLGHDEPIYEVDLINDNFFKSNMNKLWLHCKNLEALEEINYTHKWAFDNWFWHQNDDFTLTNKGLIWTYPGKKLTYNKSICVLPETKNYTEDELKKCAGICSDYIEKYKKD